MKINNQFNTNKQRGMIALFVTIVMLLLISMVTLIATRAVINEQHVATNLLREKSAYENAEAGLQFAKDYLRNGYDQVTAGTFDTNIMNIAVDASLPIPTVDLSQTPGTTLGLSHVLITSTGVSDDSLGTRTVYEERFISSVTGGSATYPLIARTSVGIGGTGDIVNPISNGNVWSGGNVDITGNGETFISDDAGVLQVISDKTAKGVDIVDNDARLANLTPDEFFQNFFNGSKELIRSQAIDLAPADQGLLYDASFNNNQLIWLTESTTLESNKIIGCSITDYSTANSDCLSAGGTIEPVVLIVDGSIDTRGVVDFYGILYVIGEPANDPAWDPNGTFNVYGSVIVEQNVGGNGTFNLTYDNGLLGNYLGGFIGTKVPNSWRDFQSSP